MCFSSLPLTARRSKGNSKRALQVTGSGKSLHDPISMYEDETMASLKEKLARAEEVCTFSLWAHAHARAHAWTLLHTHVVCAFVSVNN